MLMANESSILVVVFEFPFNFNSSL